MGLWSVYFFAKFLLYALGYMDFNPWLNLAFAVFTALTPKNARQRFAKNLIAVPVGIVLLYHDSWLPPMVQAMSQLQNLRAFSAAYLWELAGRLVSWKLLLELAAILALYALARRKLRMSTFVFIGIIAIMILPHGPWWPGAVPGPAAISRAPAGPAMSGMDTSTEALDSHLAQFYSAQKRVQIRFSRPPAEDVPYDILMLHVCSLSWDDLKTAQIAPDTFFGRFDVVLSNFNAAASYSGPAAIRLLRGACGQTPESKLYDRAAGECLVMDGLQNAGFEPHWLMNHDGHFGNFFGDVRDRGGLSVPLENIVGATPAQQSFDNTPIYSDYSVLSRWWARRQANQAPRIALYYNTISLHDGNRVLGPGRADSSYGARLAQFTSDVGRFFGDLRKSGRRVIVVVIAEHGAALGGDRRQISGLREIPTAAIAHVPVAIAFVNAPGAQQRPQQKLDTSVSYPAVIELLSRFIANSPFDQPGSSLDTYVQGLPQSGFVAENNGTTVMEAGGRYMMRSPDGAWSTL
jgi:cellulose synthase operon protein YhjU